MSFRGKALNGKIFKTEKTYIKTHVVKLKYDDNKILNYKIIKKFIEKE